jgi:DNA-binding NarL/FixJ family response regulator
MPTSVLLIDDHELIRQGLSRAFERSEDFTVIGQAGNLAEGERMVAEAEPHVVVIDVRLPDGSGLDAAKRLRAANADLGIVVLTMYAGDEQLFAALEAAIARKLFISESTAKTHISKIYDKLGAANRAQAIMNAIRAGLLRDVAQGNH